MTLSTYYSHLSSHRKKNNKKINKPVVANPGKRDTLCVAFSAATPLVPRASEADEDFEMLHLPQLSGVSL